MHISDIDKNLRVESTVNKSDVVWYDARDARFRIHGSLDENRDCYRRFPKEISEKVSEGVDILAKNTAGMRLRLRTDSPYIAIHAEWEMQCIFSHMPMSGTGGFDLYKVNDDGSKEFVFVFMPPYPSPQGYESVIETPFGMHDYIINFPLYNDVAKLYVGLSEGAAILTPGDYRVSKPVVFYGSSITQGGCASRPGNAYQSMLSRALDFDFINMGFSGCGLAEDVMCEYLAGLEMSCFVSDYDHNAPGIEHLEKTHWKLYETVRRRHPDLPYVIMTKPDARSAYKEQEQYNLKRRDFIMANYERAVSLGDRNVYFVDGYALFEDDETCSATVDTCHPNDMGFYFFYRALKPVLKKILGE
ncbi:MAG: hypothetical protein ILO53_06145 [Clostridia bacterium]|nr:hypothetical protein [Clostridia bacterium]